LETISQTRIQAKIISILGTKLDAKADCFKPVKFNINANLEEMEHGFNSVSLGFAFIIITEPKVVKYQIDGRTDIQGQTDQIKKLLAPHPSTRIPMVLKDIYQQVYAQIFVLSKMIDTPCPSPDLLSSSQPMISREREAVVEVSAQMPAEVSSQVKEEPHREERPRKKSSKKVTATVTDEPSADGQERSVVENEVKAVSSE